MNTGYIFETLSESILQVGLDSVVIQASLINVCEFARLIFTALSKRVVWLQLKDFRSRKH